MKKTLIILVIILIIFILFFYKIRIKSLELEQKNNFTDGKNYSTVNTAKFNSDSEGFSGGVYDGRFIYFSPIRNLKEYFGQITRYDSQKPFSDSSAWSFFDTTKFNPDSRGFGGAVYDGKYIYYFIAKILIYHQ